MKHGKHYKMVKENKTGRNILFVDTDNGRKISDKELSKRIAKNLEDAYHNRKINGNIVPVSNPDKNKDNNLE